LRARLAVFVAIVQFILLLAHWFLYDTWIALWGRSNPPVLRIAVALLSVSFVAASVLAFRSSSLAVRLFYHLAALWLGAVNFLFLAACACWAILLIALASGHSINRPIIAAVLFALGILASAYAALNARWIREKRVKVNLPEIPEAWRGRTAVLVSDLHLGHVNQQAFLRRMIARINRLSPDVVFLTGDLYDGTKVDAKAMIAPWQDCSPPLGTYFVTGNHEEFSDPSHYLQAIRDSGMQVLRNEMLDLEGLQIVGVDHRVTLGTEWFQAALRQIGIDPQKPSILLSHSPHLLAIPEAAGISLQLSGHTHGGQIFPFTWFTRRIFGLYTHGLKRFGKMLVYTTFGAGTWGPPMRFGTYPEIVLIEFA
jgi:predicted MPP superfamily phosphohydrolase